MPRKHISQQKASSDIPEYLLPPHPSERNSRRPPPFPFHMASNPRHLPPPAGATADGLVNPDHVSLQEFCPALRQQLQGQHSSSRSTSTAAPTRRCITPRWSAQKPLRGDSHARDSGPLVEGIKKALSPNIHAMHVKLCAQQLSVLMGAHLPAPPQSWRQQLMLRIVHKV